MAQWKPGDEVWAARFWCGKIETLSVAVKSAGPRQARLTQSHPAMGYCTTVGHEEGARSKREALLVLKGATAQKLDDAKSAVLGVEGELAAVESALAVLEEN